MLSHVFAALYEDAGRRGASVGGRDRFQGLEALEVFDGLGPFLLEVGVDSLFEGTESLA